MEIRHQGTADIHDGNDTSRARRTLPRELHTKAAGLLDRIAAATTPVDLRVPNANRLEAMKGDRTGWWSVRINDQYRIVFRWINGEAVDVEIVDYH